MTDRSRTTDDDRSQNTHTGGFRRREFVALGAGVSATVLAGCAGGGGLPSVDGSDGADGSGGSNALTGSFRLLISDAPADIADFDQLNVTLDEARLFEARDESEDDDDDDEEDDDEEDDGEEDEDADDDDEEAGTDQTGNETDDGSDPANETADVDDDDADDDEEDDEADDDDEDDEDADVEDADVEDADDESDPGFTVVDLDGATVDLTRVIGDDATTVFDGEIPAGSYEKIELSVTTVEGIVDGAEVDVKLPSEKLQITNGFEVTPDEPVSFVFDINVVKRGPNNGYILKPVISGSGVAGRDVDVNEIDDDDDDEENDDDDDGEENDDDDGDSDDEGDDDEGTDDDSTGSDTDADSDTDAGNDSDPENGS